MSAQIRLRGRKLSSTLASTSELPTSFGARVDFAADVGAAARSEGEAIVEDAQPDDLLEVDLGGGLKLWMTVEQYLKDTGDQTFKSRSRTPHDLPLEYPGLRRGTERGRVKWAVLALKKLGFDVVDEGADLTIDFVAETIESRLQAAVDGSVGGLFPFDGQNLEERNRVSTPGDIGGKLPILIFLHGTFSTTRASFGDLFARHRSTAWSRLQEAYAGRIYGFDHRSLTDSPIQNARDLLQLLPAGVSLHLVSHSRGGMVGELLCAASRKAATGERAFDDETIEGFERAEDRQALTDLNELFRQSAPTIERFVRVACPARGTTLMDGRLDLWLSTVVNVAKWSAKAAGKALDVPTGGLAGDLTDIASLGADLLVAAAKKRSDPTALPGLEAMLPTSKLVRLFNTYPQVTADLTVIAGDFDGGGPLTRLAEFVSDRFYGEDHDFVVPTASMRRGIQRDDGTLLRAEGPHVNHMTYFAESKTANAVADALLGDGITQFDVLSQRGRPSEQLEATARGAAREVDAGKPWLYVLPGILGSNLSVDGNQIWLDWSDLAKGRIKRLDIEAGGVTATSLNAGAYSSFVGHFRQRFNVVPFAYDWRLSLDQLGRQLADALEETLAATSNQIFIMAHSMGGLVSRAMMVERSETWDRIVERGGRLVMAGTPNAGSYSAVRVLLGKGKLINLLAFVDVPNSKEELLDVVNDFPGYLQLLPQPGDDPEQQGDHFALDTWLGYREVLSSGWSTPNGNTLRSARSVLRRVRGEQMPHADRVKYVAGTAEETPAGVKIEGKRIRIVGSRRGDGTVLWDGGIPEGVDAWFAPSKHGNLLDLQGAFVAYHDLLTLGTTTRLRQSPPRGRSRSRETIYIEEPADAAAPQFFPDEQDILEEYLGGEVSWADETAPLRVSVCHGDLRWATNPVLLGHYLEDGIYNAEAALDETLDYRLSQRLNLDDYPGDVGTAAVFLDEGPVNRTGAKGAIVVGLGTVGDLQRGHLMATLDRGLRAYAGRCSELNRQAGGLAISALLVGSSEGGVGTEESLRCLLTAAKMANGKIHEVNQTVVPGDSSQKHIDRVVEIEVFELYKDRALQAQRYLLELVDEAEFRGWLEIEELLQRRPGGFRRTVFETPSAWWTRLTVESQGDPAKPQSDPTGFKFTALAERARSAEHEVVIQWPLVNDLLSHALAGDNEALCERQALFELMLPNAFKRAAAEERNVVLVVDTKAASYPWELFLDRGRDARRGAGPAHIGMLRSLREGRPSAVSHPAELRAFVLGDPTPKGDPDFVQLDGARDEAKAVVQQLNAAGWRTDNSRVRDHTDLTTSEVLCELFDHDYRVLHLAGHGVYDAEHPQRSGMIIGSADGSTYEERAKNRRLLTPGEVRQMRMTPELVFINCCFLGSITDPDDPRYRDAVANRNLLAGNLATEFIRMGVKAVVAAGWAVDDRAAMVFADVFYTQMLRGRDFGEVVTLARRAAYEAAPGSNTWAAYQCYGNPQFRLVAGEIDDDGWRPRRYVDPNEPILDLRNLVATAKQGNERSREQCGERAHRIEKALPEGWERDPEIAEALGAVYGELGDFERAVGFYRQAIDRGQEKHEVSIRAIEQLANLSARNAEAKVIQQADRGDLDDEFKWKQATAVLRGIEKLKYLLAIGRSGEREALLGSAYKSLATIYLTPVADAEGVAEEMLQEAYEAIAEMTRHYHAAREADPTDLYPATNTLVGAYLLKDPRFKPFVDPDLEEATRRILKDRKKLATTARRKADNPQNFWDLTYVLDVLQTEYLAYRTKERKARARAEWEQRRQEVFQSPRGSVRERRSSERQERFLKLVLPKEWIGG